ncbi:hypothetical protein C4D60_Mb07t19090 [Musa balbisiana]|uniref:Uncharacterized protein n=1 Tax=Musa balbisiana TaxID=52838 RepID=A0A4S8JGM7_MUSBA|nr:hypothetical protein C4D60_Mb07t19090 [Musa balbisiana]
MFYLEDEMTRPIDHLGHHLDWPLSLWLTPSAPLAITSKPGGAPPVATAQGKEWCVAHAPERPTLSNGGHQATPFS